MAAEYILQIKTAAGAVVGYIDDMRGLSYSTQLNASGILSFGLRGDHAKIALLERDGQIEVRRRDTEAGIDWYTDFYGLFRDEERSADSDGNDQFTAYCVGVLDYLKRSVVAYRAGIDGRSQFTADPAETILKNLVKYNATASGTTGDGRVLNVPAWGAFLSVEADGAGGNTLTRSVSGRNLLDVCQEIAAIGDLDFWLAKTGAQAWEFRTDDTLGDDRTATVVFSTDYDNMRNPTLRRNRLGEATVAVVGGAGEEAAQVFATRTGTNYHATTNAREVWVSEQQILTANELNAAGDAALYDLEARDELTFEFVQTQALRYGRDYFLGDLVTARYQDVEQVKQIVGVTVVWQDTQGDKVETIDIFTANP